MSFYLLHKKEFSTAYASIVTYYVLSTLNVNSRILNEPHDVYMHV